MPILKIEQFRGLLPKVDDRRLPPGYASVAEDVRFDAGDLSPIRESEPGIATPGDIGELFYLRDDQSGHAPRFFAFGNNNRVDFLRGPTPDDTHRRFYWCIGNDSSPEGGLRAITNPLDAPTPNGAATGSGSGYRPFQGYRVGIPAPMNAPEATDATPELAMDYGTVVNISPTSPITITADGEVPFADGDQVRIVINPDHPTGDEQTPEDVPEGDVPGDSTEGRIWQLSGKTGNVANIGAAGVDTFDIIGVSGAIGSDLTSEEVAAIRIERVVNDADLEARVYVYTYVSQFGEEGPPSPPSNVLTSVLRDGGRVDLTLSDGPWDFGIQGGDRRYVNRFRLYRKVVGSQSGVFLFVGEGNFPNQNMEMAWNEQTEDTASSVELGEPLASEQWYPPTTMEGVQMMPNGFMVGWKGNTLYFSEPYLPHAWNPDYKRTVDNDILGLQVFGNTLVVGTRGRPYLATGTDPASMSLQKLDTFAPLARPRAMVDAGTGVLYPSTTGIMLVSRNGVQNLTEGALDKRTWEEELDMIDRGIFHDGRILFFKRDENPFVIDLNGESVDISRLSASHDYAAACIADEDLALVRRNGSVYNLIQVFKVSGENETLTWQSGLLTLPRASNMAVCQVFATGYPLQITLCHANLQSGQPNLSDMTCRPYTVNGPEPFRLPSDYLSREFRIGIQSEHRVQTVVFASSMDEIRAQ